MKNNIWTIMKKEFARTFGDKRLLVMLLLPGLMIYLVYSFMGSALSGMMGQGEEYLPVIYAENLPTSLAGEAMADWDWADLREIGTEIPDAAAAKERIAQREADLVVLFPSDFDAQVAVFDVQTATAPAPNIEIFFNSADLNSQGAFGTLTALLDAYESSLANKFDINRDNFGADLATAEDTTATLIASLLPLLLLIFLFSGCVGLAPESIAGEKERGTIGALLVSPLKRSELAIGKILSLGVLAFCAGLVSVIASVLALPKLMGVDGGVAVAIYGARDYASLALIILSTILLLVTLISIISAFAKTVKEANTSVMPLMIVVMLIGVTGMFGAAQTSRLYYLVPLYNSVQSMSGIFSLDYSAVNIAITTLSNLLYAFIGGFVLTKMFNSERIMFSK